MEHVRHLLFAQQHHFGPHLPKGFRWSSAGVPPPNSTGERRLSPVGSEPGTTIDEVFDAWAKINDVVRGLCNERGRRTASGGWTATSSTSASTSPRSSGC